MVEDPDAMWKPGPTAPASDRHEPRAEPDTLAVGGELPDRFRPATGPRRVQRARPAPAGDSSATTTLADPPESETPQIVAVVDGASRNRSMIVGVDATSGAQRWRRSFSFAPPEASMLGVFDGVVVIEQTDLSSRELIGLSTVDGATLWERETADGGANTVLLGTDLVTHLSSTVNGLITFVDPRTGEAVGDVVGELLSTDLAGAWYLASGDEIVSIDLSDGWSEPVDAAVVGAPPTDVMVVVDGRLLVADASGRVSELTAAGVGAPLGGDDIPRVDSLFPAGDSSFVGLNSGEVFGVELVR